MFNRARPQSPSAEGSTTPPPADDGHEADASEIDRLLRRLEEVASPAETDPSSGLDRLSDEVTGHTESLRASARAQREAQRLLGVAARERAHVSAEVSAMLTDARELTDRLRNEAQQHADAEREATRKLAAEERRAIEEVLRTLREKAEREAEEFVAGAREQALEAAEQEAQEYVRRASELAARDAEAHREKARGLLVRSEELITGTTTALEELVEGMDRTMSTLGTQLGDLRELLEAAELSVRRASAAEEIGLIVEQPSDQGPDEPTPQPDPTPAKKATRSQPARKASAPRPAPRGAGRQPLGSRYTGDNA